MPKCCIDRSLLLCRQAQSHFNLDLFQHRRNMLYWHLGDQTLGDPARRFVLLGKHSGKIDIILHRNDCSIQDHFLHHIPDFLLMQAKLRYRYLLIEQFQR